MANNEQTNQSGLMSGQVDDQLLQAANRNSDSNDKAGAFREAQRNGNYSDDQQANEGSSFNENRFKNRQAQAIKNKKGADSSLAAKLAAPARKGISSLIRQAWTSLIYVASIPLSVAWINIHAFLNLVIGSRFFCNLGEEWADLAPGGSSEAKEALQKKAGRSIGLMEKAGLGCLNLSCLMLLMIQMSFLILMLKMVNHPVEFLIGIMGYIWDAVSSAVVAFVSGE